MMFAKMFERFCNLSPLTVMARATLEFALAPQRINEIFERCAEVQYTRALTMATLVDLMAPVVCGIHQSTRSSYQQSPQEIGASLKAVYDKLKGIETQVSETLVRESAAGLAAVIDAMEGGRAPLLPGYRVKILDGNCLAATEHRLAALRALAAGPLPGKSLVVLDPRLMLAIDIFACEDGHAQERSLLDRVLETIAPEDLWIADRNFCTAGFLSGIAQRGGFFLVRYHRGLALEPCGQWHEAGPGPTGYVMECPATIVDPTGQELPVRRVRVQLATKTRDGDDELLLLTNLPAAAADAITVANLYRDRWLLETAFLHLTETLHCELNTLGFPKAALFSFCVAVMSYNALATVRAALRACHGQENGDDNVSMYYLADEIVGPFRGMAIALGEQWWEKYRAYTPAQLGAELLLLAQKVNLKRLKKAKRGPKKPPTPKTKAKNKPHVSTQRLLNAQKAKKKTP